MKDDATTIKHYVEYEFPFCFELAKREVEVKVRKISTDLPFERIPIRFRFFDIEEVIIEGKVHVGEKKNFSNTYYVGKTAIYINKSNEVVRKCCCVADGRIFYLNYHDMVITLEQIYDHNSCKV